MRRVKVLSKGLNQEEIKAILQLAEEAGCLPEELELVTTLGEPTPDCDDELVLVVLSPTVCASTDLEEELKKTPNGGRRAICVWASGDSTSIEPPKGAATYAYSIIPWSADKLRAVSADSDEHCFETAGGTPLPKAHMEHNLCIDEKAKAKAKQK